MSLWLELCEIEIGKLMEAETEQTVTPLHASLSRCTCNDKMREQLKTYAKPKTYLRYLKVEDLGQQFSICGTRRFTRLHVANFFVFPGGT